MARQGELGQNVSGPLLLLRRMLVVVVWISLANGYGLGHLRSFVHKPVCGGGDVGGTR